MPVLPPLSVSGILKYEWIDPYGVTRDLTPQTSPRLFVGKGATGLGMAEAAFSDDKLPFASGSLLRHVNVPPRRMQIPIIVAEDSLGDRILRMDALRSWFATANERRQAPGYLRVTRPDGSIRQIAAYYAGGLGGDMAQGALGYTQAVLELYCPDPFPTASTEQVRTWTYPFSQFPTTYNEINAGDIEAFPVWTFTSATAVNLAASNATTAQDFAFTTSFIFPGAASVTIDTRPASFRTTSQIYDSNAVNRFRYLNPVSNLFWLEPGSNLLAFTSSGIAAGNTLELRYWPRYLGLLG